MEHTECPYSAGQRVKVLETGARARITCVVACGDPGHGEIRYYLDKMDSKPFYYAHELALDPGRRKWRRAKKNG